MGDHTSAQGFCYARTWDEGTSIQVCVSFAIVACSFSLYFVFVTIPHFLYSSLAVWRTFAQKSLNNRPNQLRDARPRSSAVKRSLTLQHVRAKFLDIVQLNSVTWARTER